MTWFLPSLSEILKAPFFRPDIRHHNMHLIDNSQNMMLINKWPSSRTYPISRYGFVLSKPAGSIFTAA